MHHRLQQTTRAVTLATTAATWEVRRDVKQGLFHHVEHGHRKRHVVESRTAHDQHGRRALHDQSVAEASQDKPYTSPMFQWQSTDALAHSQQGCMHRHNVQHSMHSVELS